MPPLTACLLDPSRLFQRKIIISESVLACHVDYLENIPSVRIDLAVYADTPWPSPTVMQSVLVAVAASNGGHHPKATRSMFSHPAMGGRHWRRPLQNITVQAENIHASPLRPLRLGEKKVSRGSCFSLKTKAALNLGVLVTTCQPPGLPPPTYESRSRLIRPKASQRSLPLIRIISVVQ